MDLVGAIYNQCHEHLRDADKKRDELIAFYAVVVGLLFATYDKVSDELKVIVVVVVALVGVFAVLATLQYRKWHVILSNCFQALQQAARKNPNVVAADVTEAWNGLKIPTTWWRQASLLNPLGGTEAATFDALLVLSFLPWYLLPKLVPELVWFPVASDLLGFIIGFLFYLVAATVVGMTILHRANKKLPFEHWILSPFS